MQKPDAWREKLPVLDAFIALKAILNKQVEPGILKQYSVGADSDEVANCYRPQVLQYNKRKEF